MVRMQVRGKNDLEIPWGERVDVPLWKADVFFAGGSGGTAHYGPKSTRYAEPFTTTATEGPERSGLMMGVPVPRMTSWVLVPWDRAVVAQRIMAAVKNSVRLRKVKLIGLQKSNRTALPPKRTRDFW
jgi:hypothetical protein